MVYQSAICSTENLTKAVKRLPEILRKSFYKATKDVSFGSGDVTLVKVPPYNVNTNAGAIDGKFTDKHIVFWLCNQPHRLMECEKFIKNNLQERKEFVSTNKLCWNCLSKAHFKSKYRCKIDKCGKHHHSLLHEPEPPDKKHPQENKGQTLPVLVNSHHKSNCYLQVIPVILSNVSFKVKTNALLDSASDSTLVSQDTADKLGLKGENRQLQISNVFNTQINHLSKLVEFNISSDMHSNPLKFHIPG